MLDKNYVSLRMESTTEVQPGRQANLTFWDWFPYSQCLSNEPMGRLYPDEVNPGYHLHSPYCSLHAFHNLIVPSSLPVAYRLPSGENWIDQIGP
jgi:hypothetical protein